KALLPFFEGLRHSPLAFQASLRVRTCDIGQQQRCFHGLIHMAIKPLADRVIVKIKSFGEETRGGGVVVAVGEGRTAKTKVGIGVHCAAFIILFLIFFFLLLLFMFRMPAELLISSKEFDGSSHILLKEDDIVGILDSDDVKDLLPPSDRVFIKIAQAEGRTTGGLILTEASKEKPTIAMVIAVGPGSLVEEEMQKPLFILPSIQEVNLRVQMVLIISP
ncbi:GroES chaperonin family protein, partial [Dioscorea alata]